MRSIILLLLFITPFCTAYAKVTETEIVTVLQINTIFNETIKMSTIGLLDAVDKEEKMSQCIQEYVKKQAKTYLQTAQGNLFNLIHDFDNLVSKIYGKKGLPDNIPYEEKVAVLAKLQCEAYYKMGVLK